MFSRATIRLGIGPHSNFFLFLVLLFFRLLWPPYVMGAIIFLPCDFYLLSIVYLSFFPRLISAATDWISTILLHMAWP